MKGKIVALSILLGALLLTGCVASQEAGWELAKELNPQGKSWVAIANQEIYQVFSREMRRSQRDPSGCGFGYGFGCIRLAAERFMNSCCPLVTVFSPDQIVLEKIPEKYHFLFVIGIDKLKKVLTKGECIIISRKVKTNTEEEGYITLIAASNKKALEKAIARFFSLEEIPLEPIIWKPK